MGGVGGEEEEGERLAGGGGGGIKQSREDKRVRRGGV